MATYSITGKGEKLLEVELDLGTKPGRVLTDLNLALLLRSSHKDIELEEMVQAGRPYRNRRGTKTWADPVEVLYSLDKLVKRGLVVRV